MKSNFVAQAILVFMMIYSLLSGCKTPENTSEAKADFTDAEPANDETWTEARIISFNKYAEDLLNYTGKEPKTYNETALQLQKSFAAAGITNYAPLSSYRISLGGYGECFGESGSDYGIWWNAHRDAIKRQIEEAALFVRDFHYLKFGSIKGAFSFREVIICPEAKIGTKMLLDGYKLKIGVPYSLGYYRPIANTGSDTVTLRGLWDQGYPLGIGQVGKGLSSKVRALFSKEEKTKAALKSLWTLFNPIAPARLGMRRLLHEHRETTLAALQRYTAKGASPDKGTLKNLAFPEGGNQVINLQQESAKTMQQLLINWKCLLASSEAVNDAENDAMTMVQDNIKRTNIRNNVEAGLVAVVNHHDVGVLLAIGTGTYNKYLDASVIQEFKVDSRVRAGLIAVSTSDNIAIDVRFLTSIGKAFRAGTFEQALADARIGVNSCN